MAILPFPKGVTNVTLSPTGATLGDALIQLTHFAQAQPGTFLLTVPVTLGLSLVVAALATKVLVLGPLGRDKSRFDRARARARKPRKEQPHA